MQHNRLLVIVDLDVPYGTRCPRSEAFACTRNTTIISNLAHQKFYAIARKLKATFGPLAVVMINGKERVIDGSVPTHLDRIPRDAIEITGDLAEDILHSQDGYHSWTGRYTDEVIALLVRRP